MVMRLRKLLEPLHWNPLANLAKLTHRQEAGEDTATELADTDLIDLEELVNEKAKDLEEAREQLRQLSTNTGTPGDGKGGGQVKDPAAELLQPAGETVNPPAGADAAPPPEMALDMMKVSADGKEDGLKLDSAPAEEPIAASKLPEGLKVESVVATDGGSAANPAPTDKPPDGGSQEKKSTATEASDMIAKIFNQEDETANPLAGLVASLPDATAEEILNEAREIKAMLDQWPQN